MKYNSALCLREERLIQYLSCDGCKKSIMVEGKELYVFVDLEKVIGRVIRKLLKWAMRKKGIPEAMVKSVMSVHKGAKTRVRVHSELSQEFRVKVWMHKGSMLPPFLFAAVIDVVSEMVSVCQVSCCLLMT